jgi:hypothetical protein
MSSMQMTMRMQALLREAEILCQRLRRMIAIDMDEAQRCSACQTGKFLRGQLAGIEDSGVKRSRASP